MIRPSHVRLSAVAVPPCTCNQTIKDAFWRNDNAIKITLIYHFLNYDWSTVGAWTSAQRLYILYKQGLCFGLKWRHQKSLSWPATNKRIQFDTYSSSLWTGYACMAGGGHGHLSDWSDADSTKHNSKSEQLIMLSSFVAVCKLGRIFRRMDYLFTRRMHKPW